MRNLTDNEINNVSGAASFTAIGSLIGSRIGNGLNQLSKNISGKEPEKSYITGAINIGYGIGEFLDNLNNRSVWGDAWNNTQTGITQLINAAVTNSLNDLKILLPA
ncbi:MAG: hypothetical protein M3Z93_03805 [Commensalibacter sp.]|nr:hypothetical protein [Commensalibacter sp.]